MISDRFLTLIERAALTDTAHHSPRHEYDRAVHSYLKSIPIKNIMSVYQVGSTEIPGLSDIDLLVVMKDRKRDLLGRYSIKRLNSRQQYLFSHECCLMDQSTFSMLPYWFPYFDLNHLYGIPITIDEKHRANPDLSLILLLNFMITKVPCEFLLYGGLKGFFHERTMIAMVNSLTHTVKLWDRGSETSAADWRNFLEEFRSFRSNWFGMRRARRTQRLKMFVALAIEISLEITKRLDEFMRARWGLECSHNPSEPTEFSHKYRTFLFQNDWSVEAALNLAIRTKGRKFAYPASFKILLEAFLPSRGPVGNHIRCCLKQHENAPLEVAPKVAALLKRHVRVIEGYARFHAMKFHAPAHGYHTYWAPHTCLPMRRRFDTLFNALGERWIRVL